MGVHSVILLANDDLHFVSTKKKENAKPVLLHVHSLAPASAYILVTFLDATFEIT